MFLKGILIVAAIICLNIQVLSQTLKIRGKVIDAETNEPIPFASVALNDGINGTISDINGEFFLERKTNADSVHITFVGYKKVTYPVNNISFQEIIAYLEKDNIEIEEVVITPGENPAHAILRKIRENKDKNSHKDVASYQCEVYNKMEIDFNNVDEKFQDRKALNQFKFIFENVDTSALTGKAYLPIFITETISDYYFKVPDVKREIIKASKMSGINDPTLSQYTGLMFQKVDIYDNFMEILVPGFVSPISDFGLLYYKYYLIDSIIEADNVTYQITYEPKRKTEKVFSGYFTVDKNTYAISSVSMKLVEGINLNYIDDFAILIDFSRISDTTWFVSREYYEVEFNLRDKGKGFVGKRTTYYSNVKINEPFPEDVEQMHVKTSAYNDVTDKSEEFWQNSRPSRLTEQEQKIYETIDSVKNVPLFKTTVNWINMIAAYYYDFGMFEYGPYYKTYSYNEIEGSRIRVGGQTSIEFSDKHRLFGHLAYGFQDEKFKYGLGYKFFFRKNTWMTAGLKITNDIKQLGQSENAFTEDNFLTSFLRRNPNYKLTMVNTVEGHFEKEWFHGISNTVTFKRQIIWPTEYIPFKTEDIDGLQSNEKNIVTSEINLNTRFAYNEQFVYGNFERISLSTKSPILSLDVKMGIPNLFGSQYKYIKLILDVRDNVNIPPFGYFKYIIVGGKIFGALPYPLLELHKGNETYAYDYLSYNRMNYYEFVSDEYASFLVEQHFEGFFFNKIPMMKKLHLREVAYGQMLLGRLSEENKNVFIFPEGLSSLNKPYIEAGIGVENILRLIRIDAVWRLSHTEKPQNVIMMFSLHVAL